MKWFSRMSQASWVLCTLVVIALCGLLVLPGCATDPETGEKIKWSKAAPTPPEAKLIAHGMMRLAIAEIAMDPGKLTSIRDIMTDSKTVLLTGLKEDPTHLDVIRLNYLKTKNPELGNLANTVLQVLVLRLRPLIDQGKTELASQYIEAVLDGAVMAIDGNVETAWRRREWDIQYVALVEGQPLRISDQRHAYTLGMSACPSCHVQQPQARSALLRA